jgi:hypothetical protein
MAGRPSKRQPKAPTIAPEIWEPHKPYVKETYVDEQVSFQELLEGLVHRGLNCT